MKSRRGETIVEVTIAIVIFGLVSVLSISIMTSGVSTAQATLELTMARNEIDAQAEALRFIQNSYIAERELPVESQQYAQLWYDIVYEEAIMPNQLGNYDLNSCSEAYSPASPNYIFSDHAFVLNTRLIQKDVTGFDWSSEYGGIGSETEIINDYASLRREIIVMTSDVVDRNRFHEAGLYPRIIYNSSGYSDALDSTENDNLAESGGDNRRTIRDIYRRIERVEGLWVIPVKGGEIRDNGEPEYYDFYIRTCWYAPGRNYPYKLGTTVRLYNSELIEGDGNRPS